MLREFPRCEHYLLRAFYMLDRRRFGACWAVADSEHVCSGSGAEAAGTVNPAAAGPASLYNSGGAFEGRDLVCRAVCLRGSRHGEHLEGFTLGAPEAERKLWPLGILRLRARRTRTLVQEASKEGIGKGLRACARKERLLREFPRWEYKGGIGGISSGVIPPTPATIRGSSLCGGHIWTRSSPPRK